MGDLGADLREAVLERLGFETAPTLDIEGLTELYRSWCRSVPFDNTLKLIALHGGGHGTLPGMDAEQFFRAWLEHGTGGTCWPSANAVHALVSACGFRSRLVAGSMADTGIPSHGTTVVTLEGSDWLVDSSMLTDEPLRLSTDSATSIEHEVFATSAEPVEEGWLLLFPLPYNETGLPCRILAPSGVTHEYCSERYEISRESSPFNHAPSLRRNDGAGILSYMGDKRFHRTGSGIEQSDLPGDELFRGLIEEFALSEEIVTRLTEALTRLAG